MELKDKLSALDVSEKEIKYKLRGSYNTSFFHIFTAGEFNSDLSLISQEDRGTFIHEYIHYWQNIGTLWGLSSSIMRYEMMLRLKEEIIGLKEIKLPYAITLTEDLSRCDNLFRVGNGFFNDSQFYEEKLDQTKRIEIRTYYQIVYEKKVPIVSLVVTFENGATCTLELGAHIIKESMAALYQSMVDPEAQHDDVPYNVVKALCKHNYPSLFGNPKLLICCCHAALFSMTPGDTLIMLLAKAEKDNITNGTQLFSDYINQSTISTEQGKNIPVPDYFDNMVDLFLEKLNQNLFAPLDYIKKVMERVRLSNQSLPLLAVLYEEKTNSISTENLNTIIGWTGIPYIHTENNGYHFPATAEKISNQITEKDVSVDVIELIAQEAMSEFLTKEQPYRCCPFYAMMCNETSFAKEECFGKPWLGTDCCFTHVSTPLKLNEKDVHW